MKFLAPRTIQQEPQRALQAVSALHAEALHGLLDKRSDQAAQRQLSNMADRSMPVTQQMALNARADASARVVAQAKMLDAAANGGTAQLAKEEELQPKLATAQLAKEEELQPKMATAQLAKEEELQPKMAPAQLVEDELAQHKRSSPVQKQEPNRTGMPDQLKSGVENLSGMSMDHVKVHYNSPQPAQLNALAYAQGSDIHVGPGQEQHLPHEAWHVVQQAQGRVQPTTQMKEGTPVNNDPNLEHEADVMGAKAMQMRVGPAAWQHRK